MAILRTSPDDDPAPFTIHGQAGHEHDVPGFCWYVMLLVH
jgi:hypothetical protein